MFTKEFADYLKKRPLEFCIPHIIDLLTEQEEPAQEPAQEPAPEPAQEPGPTE